MPSSSLLYPAFLVEGIFSLHLLAEQSQDLESGDNNKKHSLDCSLITGKAGRMWELIWQLPNFTFTGVLHRTAVLDGRPGNERNKTQLNRRGKKVQSLTHNNFFQHFCLVIFWKFSPFYQFSEIFHFFQVQYFSLPCFHLRIFFAQFFRFKIFLHFFRFRISSSKF